MSIGGLDLDYWKDDDDHQTYELTNELRQVRHVDDKGHGGDVFVLQQKVIMRRGKRRWDEWQDVPVVDKE